MEDGKEKAAIRPEVIRVARRGPVLRPSPREPGLFGLDLTAGCLHGCAYCYIRGTGRYPGDGRVYFDPSSALALEAALDELGDEVKSVVMSPMSDPLPPQREIRAEAVRAASLLLDRGIATTVITRGRVPRAMVDVLAAHPGRAKVALGMTSLNKSLVRALEPRSASPRGRLRDLARLVEAGVEVEVRLEPMIAGLTDTRENLEPLLRALGKVGARRVVTHYLFLHPATTAPLAEALVPLGWSERLQDDFAGGPAFPIGSIGTTKHLPRESRRQGLARIVAWGASHGLIVTTGSAQNPDLPRSEPPSPPVEEHVPSGEEVGAGV